MPKVSGYCLRKWILGTLLLTIAAMASGQYQLKILPVDKDAVFITKTLGLQQDFANRLVCTQYIDNLTANLFEKGYPSASVDSVGFDSTSATIKLFLGEAYKLAYINTGTVNKRELEQAGWNEKNILNKPLDIERLQDRRVVIGKCGHQRFPF